MGMAGLRVLTAALLASLALPAAADPARPVIGGATLATTGVVAGHGAPQVPNVSAAGWVVADADTGEVLAARNPHGRYLPASTLKTLTAVALLPDLDLTATYRPSFAEVNIEGSRVGLVEGVPYAIGKLVEAMLVVSGNDAANAVAGAAGGMTAAVARMNATARRLQAFDTTASNPSGLDAPGQYTSAYDLALIARAGLAIPAFAKYASTLRDTVPAPGGKRFEIYNHNKLLTRYRGNVGVKTGYTNAARHTYVGAARRNGHTVIVTLMRAETMYPDATALLDWGFAAIGRAVPVGRLVEPASDGDDTRADRSRVVQPTPVPPAAVVTGRGTRSSMPAVPAAGAIVSLGSVVLLRRRVVRRRRGYGASSLSLRLPVR